jgi:hypothetical protein
MAKKQERQKNKGAQNESGAVTNLPADGVKLEDFIRAALQTGRMPVGDSRPSTQKKKAAKREPRKGGK